MLQPGNGLFITAGTIQFIRSKTDAVFVELQFLNVSHFGKLKSVIIQLLISYLLLLLIISIIIIIIIIFKIIMIIIINIKIIVCNNSSGEKSS